MLLSLLPSRWSSNLLLTKWRTQRPLLLFFLHLTTALQNLGCLTSHSQYSSFLDWMKISRRLWASTRVSLSPCGKYSQWKVQFPCFNPDPLKVQLLSYFNQHSFTSLGRGRLVPYVVSTGVTAFLTLRRWEEMVWNLSHLHFIIKMLMDHSRKSLQSFQLLLLDVVWDILGTSTVHLYLAADPGKPKVSYIQH